MLNLHTSYRHGSRQYARFVPQGQRDVVAATVAPNFRFQSAHPPLSLRVLSRDASTSSWTRSIDLKYLTVFTRSSAIRSVTCLDLAHTSLRTSRRILIHDNQCPGVRLQCRQRPQVVHPMLDRHTQRERLALPGYDHDDLARIKDGLYTHRKRHARHGGYVVTKEARVCEDRIVRQSLDARTRRERGPGLVEGDVSILADPPKEELDAARGLDLRLVLFALADQVGRVSIENVYVFRVNIHYTCYDNVVSPASSSPVDDGDGVHAPCEKNSRNMNVW